MSTFAQAHTWKELELPFVTGAATVEPTEDWKEERSVSAESVIRRWWSDELASSRSTSIHNKKRNHFPIEVQDLYLERIPGSDDTNQKHINSFLLQAVKTVVAAHPEKPFLLFWGWKRRHISVRVYGGVFPKYLWQQFHRNCIDRTRQLRQEKLYKDVVVQDRMMLGAGVPTVQDITTVLKDLESAGGIGIPLPDMNWITVSLRADPRLFTERTFYLSENTTEHPDSIHKPYDGSGDMLFRPDEIPYYDAYIRKFFYCVGVMSLIEAHKTVLDDDLEQFRIMEGYMTESDLSNPCARELDYKSRLLCMLFAARLAFASRTKRRTSAAIGEQDVSRSRGGSGGDGGDCFGTPLSSASESMHKLMIQVLAYQFEARSKYIFDSESSAIRMATLNGSRFFLTDNTCFQDKEQVCKLWGSSTFAESRSKIASKKQNDMEIFTRCDNSRLSKAIDKRISLYTNRVLQEVYDPDTETRTPRDLRTRAVIDYYNTSAEAADHMCYSFQRGINSSVRYDPENNQYCVASEMIDVATERVEKTQVDGSDAGTVNNFPSSSAFYNSSLAHSNSMSNVQQVLLREIPVIFYMLCEMNATFRYADVLVDAIEHTMYLCHSSGHMSDILYYGHETDKLGRENLCLQSCNGHRFILVLLPTLIFAHSKALEKFVHGVKLAVRNSSQRWDSTMNLSEDSCKELADMIYPSADSGSNSTNSTERKLLYEGVDCYKPGFRFLYLAPAMFPREIHPSPAEFQSIIMGDSIRNDPKRKESIMEDIFSSDPDRRVANVDVYQFPACKREKAVWDRSETHRFLHTIAPNGDASLPEQILIVPKCDLSHSPLVHDITESSCNRPANRDWTCLYHSVCTGMCKTCDNERLFGSLDAPKEHYQFINYKEIPSWQFALSLKPVRAMCRELDRRNDGDASVADLDQYLEQEVGLGEIWRAVVRQCESNLKEFSQFRVELQLDHDLMRREMARCAEIIRQDRSTGRAQQLPDSPSPPGGGGGISLQRTIHYNDEVHVPDTPAARTRPDRYEYTDEIKERIRRYIALHPDHFYSKYKDTDFRREGDTIRWGKKGSFAVCMRPRKVQDKTGASICVMAGGFYDFESGDSGDVFKWVMEYHYKSKDRSITFIPALRLCHAYVLETYGLDALACDPTQRTDLPESASLLSVDKQHDLATVESRIREAKNLWKNSYEFSDTARCGSKAGVDYMRRTRSIQTSRVLFGNKTFRYHPSFPLMTRGEPLRFGAMVVALVRPYDPTKEVRGVHGVFMDEVYNTKVSWLDVQKKSRGEFSGNAVHIQAVPDTSSSSAIDEFHATIAIGEGVETMASVAEACPELNVYALLSITNVGNFRHQEVPELGTPLLYCADNDKQNPKLMGNIEKQVQKLTDKGYVVYLCLPDMPHREGTKGVDFNDILVNVLPRTEAIARIRQILKNARVYPHTFKPLVVSHNSVPLKTEEFRVPKAAVVPPPKRSPKAPPMAAGVRYPIAKSVPSANVVKQEHAATEPTIKKRRKHTVEALEIADLKRIMETGSEGAGVTTDDGEQLDGFDAELAASLEHEEFEESTNRDQDKIDNLEKTESRKRQLQDLITKKRALKEKKPNALEQQQQQQHKTKPAKSIGGEKRAPLGPLSKGTNSGGGLKRLKRLATTDIPAKEEQDLCDVNAIL